MACCRRAKMRHRVTHQTRTQTRDSVGGFVNAWADGDTFWAAIEPKTGNESENADRIEGVVTHSITARYRSGISQKDRLVFNSRTFEILYVINEDERSEYLIFDCKEINPVATAAVSWAD